MDPIIRFGTQAAQLAVGTLSPSTQRLVGMAISATSLSAGFIYLLGYLHDEYGEKNTQKKGFASSPEILGE